MDIERIVTVLAVAFLWAFVDGFWRRWKINGALRAEQERRDRLSAEQDSADH